jgi:hypothetical protein
MDNAVRTIDLSILADVDARVCSTGEAVRASKAADLARKERDNQKDGVYLDDFAFTGTPPAGMHIFNPTPCPQPTNKEQQQKEGIIMQPETTAHQKEIDSRAMQIINETLATNTAVAGKGSTIPDYLPAAMEKVGDIPVDESIMPDAKDQQVIQNPPIVLTEEQLARFRELVADKKSVLYRQINREQAIARRKELAKSDRLRKKKAADEHRKKQRRK